MKCSCIKVGDKLIDVYKDPITDKGKLSKKGRLDLIKISHCELKTINISHLNKDEYHPDSVLEVVFENGKIIKEYTLEEIRENEKLFSCNKIER